MDDTADTEPESGSEAPHGARDLLDLDLVLERQERAPEAPPRARAGDYLLLREIGRGSTATVYRAKHADRDEEVALKILHAKLTEIPRITRRFLREARAMKAIHHPNVVRVLDAGEEGGLCYIATELLDGRSLRKVIAEEAPMPVDRAIRIASQLARGLEAIHARGIVHRDLKPANVMVASDDSVKILDFGIAKDVAASATDTRLTQGGALLGTPGFMAPEQEADASNVSPAADLFALGIIISEMLGRIEVPPDDRIQPIVDALIAEDPASRPATATQVAAMFDHLLAPRPPASAPPPPHPLFAAAMVALPLAVLLVTVFAVQTFDEPTQIPAEPEAPAAPAQPRAEPREETPPENPTAEEEKRATPRPRTRIAPAAQMEPNEVPANDPVDPEVVRKRLESIAFEIRRRSASLTKEKLDDFETRYFEIRSALTPDTPLDRCEDLLRRAVTLERDLAAAR